MSIVPILDFYTPKRTHRFKFIVAELTVSARKPLVVVRAHIWLQRTDEEKSNIFHDQILGTLRREANAANSEYKVKMLGGGVLHIDTAVKTVRLSGQSREYGREPDREATVNIFQTQLPRYAVTAE